MLDKKRVRLSFAKAADNYEKFAVLQLEMARRLLERLDYIRIAPKRVLDLGAGSGYCSQRLLQLYPRAQVIALDFALPMVCLAQRQHHQLQHPSGLCADMEQLPLKSQSIDLVVSNAALQWSCNLPAVFSECRRVLKPGGLLMFTTFGPDTLKELRSAWAMVDQQKYQHTSNFTDMHDIGDLLLATGFSDPVMDKETVTQTYRNLRLLLEDIRRIGAANACEKRRRTLTGKRRMRALFNAYEQFRCERQLISTWELVYGQAWMRSVSSMPEDTKESSGFTVSVERLKQKLKKEIR